MHTVTPVVPACIPSSVYIITGQITMGIDPATGQPIHQIIQTKIDPKTGKATQIAVTVNPTSTTGAGANIQIVTVKDPVTGKPTQQAVQTIVDPKTGKAVQVPVALPNGAAAAGMPGGAVGAPQVITVRILPLVKPCNKWFNQ